MLDIGEGRQTEEVPLTLDETGTVRVGDTRLTLDTFMELYDVGATAEQLCIHFPGLALADAHAVITYVLRHENEVRQYLATRSKDADALQARIEAKFPDNEVRRRLRDSLSKMRR